MLPRHDGRPRERIIRGVLRSPARAHPGRCNSLPVASSAGRTLRRARAADRGIVSGMEPGSIADLASEIISCRRCARLVAWREEVAAHPPARFGRERYWARPLPGFGDPRARILLVGLAPAAHGGNRTGRLFTGDRSGDFLFASLHRTGFANLPTSVAVDDGLVLHDVYISAVVRCAPPDNKPTPDERSACLPYLVREMRLLSEVRVLVALGAFAWDGATRAIGDFGLRRFTQAGLHSPGGGADRAVHASWLLPSEPAEHVHRPSDTGHARRGLRPGGRARRRPLARGSWRQFPISAVFRRERRRIISTGQPRRTDRESPR